MIERPEEGMTGGRPEQSHEQLWPRQRTTGKNSAERGGKALIVGGISVLPASPECGGLAGGRQAKFTDQASFSGAVEMAGGGGEGRRGEEPH